MSYQPTYVLLVGPLTFGQIHDRLENVTRFFIGGDSEDCDEYCDEQERGTPSLMPAQDRWEITESVLDEMQIACQRLPERMATATSMQRYVVRFEQGGALLVCQKMKDEKELRRILEANGIPVVEIIPEEDL